jgi:hypothetical protein
MDSALAWLQKAVVKLLRAVERKAESDYQPNNDWLFL